MNLKELLLEFIPSKEIKERFKANQIKVNLESILNLDFDLKIQEGYWELGDFLFHNINHLKNVPYIFDLKDFFGQEETNIKPLNFLTGYTLISISKKESYVFMNK